MTKMFRLTCLALALFFFIGSPTVGTAGTIAGKVDAKGVVNVQFLDVVNAQQIAAVETNIESGVYRSGLLPSGIYRVRFSGPGYLPAFSESKPADDFCSANKHEVRADSVEEINKTLLLDPGKPTESGKFSFDIRVHDSVTFAPLEAIKVDFLIAENGQPLAATATDVDGHIKGFPFTTFHPVRVRLSDPSNRYFPEIFGALARSDDFCGGERLLPRVYALDIPLDAIPVDQQAQVLIETVKNLALPNNVSKLLGTPLVRAVDLLTDTNYANDAAVCGQLTALMSRVNVQERKGQLTAEEAEALRLLTESLKADLACP